MNSGNPASTGVDDEEAALLTDLENPWAVCRRLSQTEARFLFDKAIGLASQPRPPGTSGFTAEAVFFVFARGLLLKRFRENREWAAQSEAYMPGGVSPTVH